ncbi:hypothetical protein DFH29DRAFT_871548 [Suillus ampliporus]|nr:hypothetical protein DFH29DRAFT_871548 [Suillus ampliporus]
MAGRASGQESDLTLTLFFRRISLRRLSGLTAFFAAFLGGGGGRLTAKPDECEIVWYRPVGEPVPRRDLKLEFAALFKYDHRAQSTENDEEQKVIVFRVEKQ